MNLRPLSSLSNPRRILACARALCADSAAKTNTHMHIRYYNKVANIGDDLNMIIVSSLQGRCVYVQESGCFPHLLGIGSILHFATRRSMVWGSGFISETTKPRTDILSSMRIFALRGERTKEVLQSLNSDAKSCPLGDPGVLMPTIYNPTNIRKKYKLGIVPHLVDLQSPWVTTFSHLDDVAIIRTDQNPLSFINQIMSCDYVASSSLHGLILADAYSVPNLRMRLSDGIFGGDFKFQDYYSTTTALGGGPCIDLRHVDPCLASDTAARIVGSAVVSRYLHNHEELLFAFKLACRAL